MRFQHSASSCCGAACGVEGMSGRGVAVIQLARPPDLVAQIESTAVTRSEPTMTSRITPSATAAAKLGATPGAGCRSPRTSQPAPPAVHVLERLSWRHVPPHVTSFSGESSPANRETSSATGRPRRSRGMLGSVAHRVARITPAGRGRRRLSAGWCRWTVAQLSAEANSRDRRGLRVHEGSDRAARVDTHVSELGQVHRR
jgi:hypothetical protein